MKIEVKKEIDEKELEKIKKWPTWECDISEFDWFYDERESCYFIEGEVIVKTDTENVKIEKGDFVVFPKGLSCRWKVIKPVKKHYNFG